MDTILFWFYTIFYVALFIWTITVTPKGKFWSLRTFLLLVLIGLIYDNGIIAAGKLIGEGELLETLNLMRYWAHALFTPTLVLFSLGVLKAAGTKGMGKNFALNAALLLTAILISMEIALEIIGLELEAAWNYGVLSYSSVEAATGPPIMVLLLTVVLLIAGAVLWKTSGWAWMFIGAVIMTVGSAVPIPLESEAITNGFELTLLTILALTKRQVEK